MSFVQCSIRHFDRSLDDVFDLQDRVAISAAGVIEPALQAAEARRFAHRPANDLTTAYDLYLRAPRSFAVTPAAARLRLLVLLLLPAATRTASTISDSPDDNESVILSPPSAMQATTRSFQ